MRETAMFVQYTLAQERLERLRAEGLAAQRVARLGSGRRGLRRRLRETLSPGGTRLGPLIGPLGDRGTPRGAAATRAVDVMCRRAAGRTAGGAA